MLDNLYSSSYFWNSPYKEQKKNSHCLSLIFIFLGMINFISGLLVVGGFEGMAVSIFGFVYLALGAISVEKSDLEKCQIAFLIVLLFRFFI
ncbi:YesK family protein [Peribacillus sp. NPDC094092]|uniref:YesK family protein n=1 Tax=Peribacillus sp. NPDC094092 TaxID=3390611 RepID=UPI003D067B0C